jgi:hypothetical protein
MDKSCQVMQSFVVSLFASAFLGDCASSLSTHWHLMEDPVPRIHEVAQSIRFLTSSEWHMEWSRDLGSLLAM